jgi:serine/threonine protein kinase
MELADRGSLDTRIEKQQRVPELEVLDIGTKIAAALDLALKHNLLHRDIKPGNILFNADNEPKLVDFGLTRIAEREDQKSQFYMGVGTVAYMSPEQFQDASSISVQSDLYSLGIILYEMLTGKLPGRRSPMPSDYYDDIPRDLDDIFDRMTMDVLQERYSSVDQILLDLYRSPAVLALLRQRGPALFTDTDLGSLPPLSEPAPAPVRHSAVPLPSRTSTPAPRGRAPP